MLTAINTANISTKQKLAQLAKAQQNQFMKANSNTDCVNLNPFNKVGI